MRGLIIVALCLVPIGANAWWQSVAQQSVGASYQGPGDSAVYGTTSVQFWGSCARVFTAAQATTSTSLCDIVAVTGGAAVCTLRASSTGFVDQSAYCPGSLTPSAACAAASGGSCKVTKVYDQSGAGNHVVQATLSSMPALVFSSPNSGSLPSLNCNVGFGLHSAATFSQAVPVTISAVQIRATGTSQGGSVGGSASGYVAAGLGADLAMLNSGIFLTSTITNATWYSVNALWDTSPNSVININGSESSGNAGANNFSSTISLCRNNFTNINGNLVEGGVWFASSNTTQRNALNTNQHGVNGYNF